MEIQFFGEFLVNYSKGKITGDDIHKALLKQESFAKGYKRLGEILVEDKLLTKEELQKYLLAYDAYKLAPVK